MSEQRHPDAEELARYQAGEISGLRGRQLAAHVADCASCASVSDDLAAVSSVLASVPAPPMPENVESRITAAIAAEAATRQAAGAAAASAADSPAVSGQRSRHLRPVPSAKSHSRGFRPVMAVVSAAACLVLVGFGYLLSRTGSSSSSSQASAAAPVAAPSAAAAVPSGAAAGHAAAGSGPQQSASASSLKPSDGQAAIPFLVAKSDVNYQQATLGTQVRHELSQKSESSRTGRQSSQSTGGLPPSQTLIGCVLQVTENVPPKLVEQASYEGKAAYVIAVSDHAWVVGPGCTASHPDVMASVALPR